VDHTRPYTETDAQLDAFEDVALRAMHRLVQLALAVKDLAPIDTTTTPQGFDAGRLAITDEYARMTVECLPANIFTAINAARALRHNPEPWTGKHRQLHEVADALVALGLSRRRLDDSIDELTAASPATGALIAEAAEHAGTVINAIGTLITL
jgi:hypothetical protein